MDVYSCVQRLLNNSSDSTPEIIVTKNNSELIPTIKSSAISGKLSKRKLREIGYVLSASKGTERSLLLSSCYDETMEELLAKAIVAIPTIFRTNQYKKIYLMI